MKKSYRVAWEYSATEPTSRTPTLGLGFRVESLSIWGYYGTHYIMENQMEKKMENEMEAGII